MRLNSRTCQPGRCREGGPRQGARGKDRDERGRQGGINRGGRERVPPQRLKCCREWSSGTLAEQKMLRLVRQGQWLHVITVRNKENRGAKHTAGPMVACNYYSELKKIGSQSVWQAQGIAEKRYRIPGFLRKARTMPATL